MNFDLNIDNYTRDELIEMFELPTNFDKNILEIKEGKLRESIVNNTEINKDTQSKTLDFLIKAKKQILNTLQKESGALQEKLDTIYNINRDLGPSNLSKLENKQYQIQERPVYPYVFTSAEDTITGIINPLAKSTITKNLNIDSRFRDNYFTTSSTNFNFKLPANFNNVVKMELAAIELPTSYYVISKQYGNNFFTITVNSSTTTISIPDGNYDQTTIMDAVNNQLSLAGAPFDQVNFMANLTDGITGTGQTMVGFIDISSNTVLELNFQADRFGADDHNTPLPLKFGWLLGFRNGIYVNNFNYVSEGLIDVNGSRYLFLVVDDYNNNVNQNFYSAFNSSVLNKNILARISLQETTFNVLKLDGLTTTPREYFGPVNITGMNIQLLDEYGRIINLNNMDFSFCLNLTTVYDI
jgi:hypothetical protein